MKRFERLKLAWRKPNRMESNYSRFQKDLVEHYKTRPTAQEVGKRIINTSLIEVFVDKLYYFIYKNARGINRDKIKVFVSESLYNDLAIHFQSLITSHREFKRIEIYGVEILSSTELSGNDLHFSIHSASL